MIYFIVGLGIIVGAILCELIISWVSKSKFGIVSPMPMVLSSVAIAVIMGIIAYIFPYPFIASMFGGTCVYLAFIGLLYYAAVRGTRNDWKNLKKIIAHCLQLCFFYYLNQI